MDMESNLSLYLKDPRRFIIDHKREMLSMTILINSNFSFEI